MAGKSACSSSVIFFQTAGHHIEGGIPMVCYLHLFYPTLCGPFIAYCAEVFNQPSVLTQEELLYMQVYLGCRWEGASSGTSHIAILNLALNCNVFSVIFFRKSRIFCLCIMFIISWIILVLVSCAKWLENWVPPKYKKEMKT